MRIKLKYVNAFRNKRRKNQELRYLFRAPGRRAFLLPGLPLSEEFMSAHAAALASIEQPVQIGADRTLPGSIDALIVTYYGSAEFNELKPDTKKLYRYHLEKFRADGDRGKRRVTALEQAHIKAILAKIAKPIARRHMLNALRALFKFAVPLLRRDNPTDGITVK